MTPKPFIRADDERKALKQLRQFLARVNKQDGQGELRRILECFRNEMNRAYPPLPANVTTAASRARVAKPF